MRRKEKRRRQDYIPSLQNTRNARARELKVQRTPAERTMNIYIYDAKDFSRPMTLYRSSSGFFLIKLKVTRALVTLPRIRIFQRCGIPVRVYTMHVCVGARNFSRDRAPEAPRDTRCARAFVSGLVQKVEIPFPRMSEKNRVRMYIYIASERRRLCVCIHVQRGLHAVRNESENLSPRRANLATQWASD